MGTPLPSARLQILSHQQATDLHMVIQKRLASTTENNATCACGNNVPMQRQQDMHVLTNTMNNKRGNAMLQLLPTRVACDAQAVQLLQRNTGCSDVTNKSSSVNGGFDDDRYWVTISHENFANAACQWQSAQQCPVRMHRGI